MVGGQERIIPEGGEDGKYVCLLVEPHTGNNEKRRNAFVQSISRLESYKILKQSILNLADHDIDDLSAK